MQCVLAFLSLYVGLAHSFSWEIVTRTRQRLEFYDVNGTLTHAQDVSREYIEKITYDPVHNRVLFTDRHNIYSFIIASKTIETLVRIRYNCFVTSMTYDPVTELLFWIEENDTIYSISLKPGFDNSVNRKQLIYSDNFCHMTTVDICGGFIYWISGGYCVERFRFDSSERKTITDGVSPMDCQIHLDQHTRKVYWYDDASTSFKCADLNGKIIDLNQIRPRFDFLCHKFTFSKDHIYLAICSTTKLSVWKIPKNTPSDIDLLTESNLFFEHDDFILGIAFKYNIEDLTRGVQNCERLKSLLSNNSVTSSGCTQGYSGEACDVSVSPSYYFLLSITYMYRFVYSLLPYPYFRF